MSLSRDVTEAIFAVLLNSVCSGEEGGTMSANFCLCYCVAGGGHAKPRRLAAVPSLARIAKVNFVNTRHPSIEVKHVR